MIITICEVFIANSSFTITLSGLIFVLTAFYNTVQISEECFQQLSLCHEELQQL